MQRSIFAHPRRTARLVGLAALLPFLAVGFLIASAGTASAHARLVSSTPAPDAVLTEPPTSVTLTFAENINPSESGIVVYDATMKQVSTGAATADPSDLKTLSVPMQGDDSEVYVVVWHNVSADDGDPDAGSFTFNIGAATSTTTPGTTTTTSTASGVPVWVTALVGVLGLVIGAGGAAMIARWGTNTK